jgi:hypothetical protein
VSGTFFQCRTISRSAFREKGIQTPARIQSSYFKWYPLAFNLIRYKLLPAVM